jgi:hypothetical protein
LPAAGDVRKCLVQYAILPVLLIFFLVQFQND